LKSEVSYSEKDSYPKDTRQKEGGGQTKNIWREKCFNKAVFVNMLLLSHDFRKFTILGASIEKIRVYVSKIMAILVRCSLNYIKYECNLRLFSLTPCEYSRNKNGEASPAPKPLTNC
jgi:hypothetical protein